MKANIKVISENTGFSPATVSNALNGKTGVNKRTAELIREEAERLGYAFQSKITKIKFVTFRKNGKILDDSLFFPAVIEGVENQAKKLGYETVFIRLSPSDSDFESQLNEVIYDNSSAVILLATEMDEEDLALFTSKKKELILLDGWSSSQNFNAVLIDSMGAAYEAVEYLYQSGHRKIGYIRGDFRIKGFDYREFGYKQVLEKHGIHYEEAYVATVGTKPDTAYEDMKKYLDDRKSLPTAYFVDNDSIAMGVMKALKEKGYKIPQDVSLIGFDDIPICQVVAPGLTTIHIYKHNMGEVAVRRLVEQLENDVEANVKTEVCGRLVIRESVKRIN
ncbi:MAG: LacI family DNA-binding transcriptional regulator [Lachnospira sp.]|nr:LacI family DNA-binding transcriptional regulator [Lachnospira sp.]